STSWSTRGHGDRAPGRLGRGRRRWERGQAGRPACRWGRRRALCSRCPPSSYLRAELVRCTLRARHPGTSSWMRVVPGRRRGWVVVWRPRRWWVSGPGAVRVSALAGEPAHRLLGGRGGEVAAALGDPAADQLGLVAHERETAPHERRRRLAPLAEVAQQPEPERREPGPHEAERVRQHVLAPQVRDDLGRE